MTEVRSRPFIIVLSLICLCPNCVWGGEFRRLTLGFEMESADDAYLLRNPLEPVGVRPENRTVADPDSGGEEEDSDIPNPESVDSPYEKTLRLGRELLERSRKGGGPKRIQDRHARGRMTVWERLRVLTDVEPNIQFQNWGPHLDGDGIITGILNIKGRDVAFYGHDFTTRAGSINAENGSRLARLIYQAAEHGIPLIGMNDSAGAYVPAGVGGLDGYAEAFAALRRISGIVPSIMLMFGYNAGGGAYLPRQGSFMIQPRDTFLGLTGPGVVRDVLGEEISADELGGPDVHAQSGVVDIKADDETDALHKALQLLDYIPDNNSTGVPTIVCSDPLDRIVAGEDLLFRRTFRPPSGFNTPFDIRIMLQLICDHGDFFELQQDRAQNMITAFGRLGGRVVAWLANNSAVAGGQIEIHGAYKAARFIRFANLYNIPIIFLEDCTGFLPGSEQESAGIVQAGRALLDSIVDLRVPRILLIVRNAFGGAYSSWNSYHVGADMVFALPTARVAVMGPAGIEFVYKEELNRVRREARQLEDEGKSEQANSLLTRTYRELAGRYEESLMNPREALSLGSISRLVMPGESRRILGENLHYLLRHYQPGPMSGPQREFH